MEAYIDIRERAKIEELLSYWNNNLKSLKHITHMSTKQNRVGDLITSDGLVGIERKSESDFIPSLLSDKLKQQLYELKQNFTYPFLFVEGYDSIFDCMIKNPRVHPNSIRGGFVSVLAHSRVPISFVGSFYTPIVLHMIEKFYDGKNVTEKDYNPIRREVTKKDYAKYFVRGLTGIGETYKEPILKHFNNSIKNIVNASEEDFKKIQGIGSITAKKIVEVLKWKYV